MAPTLVEMGHGKHAARAVGQRGIRFCLHHVDPLSPNAAPDFRTLSERCACDPQTLRPQGTISTGNRPPTMDERFNAFKTEFWPWIVVGLSECHLHARRLQESHIIRPIRPQIV